jgi:hypothetical protein
LTKTAAGVIQERPDRKGETMKRSPSIVPSFGIVLLALGLVFSGPACKKVKQVSDALEFEETTTIEPEPAEAKPIAPQPKITEQIYIEIMARTALIWEKYKDAPADAERAVETVYEKFNIVHTEFRDYQQKLAPAKAAELQKNIQEFIQKIASEYRSP